jgi:hypothetical protein
MLVHHVQCRQRDRLARRIARKEGTDFGLHFVGQNALRRAAFNRCGGLAHSCGKILRWLTVQFGGDDVQTSQHGHDVAQRMTTN